MGGQHDEISKDGKYHRKCDDKNCHQCKAKYDQWCKEHEKSHIQCQKRSYTVTEYCCEKVTVEKQNYGFKERQDHGWKPTKDIEPPKHCDRCGKKAKKCQCKH